MGLSREDGHLECLTCKARVLPDDLTDGYCEACDAELFGEKE